MRGRIPADELGLHVAAVRRANRESVLPPNRARGGDDDVGVVHDAARRLTPAVDLHDRSRRRGDGVGELVGNVSESCECHAAIVSGARGRHITQVGRQVRGSQFEVRSRGSRSSWRLRRKAIA